MGNLPETQHNIEIHENLKRWQKKTALQKIYVNFYNLIASQINKNIEGKIVELGSGIGNLKMVLPNVICTDLFNNPWIDQTENAYKLSFADETVSNLILFDVWHHLEFPGDALQEFKRVLKPGGRVILFEPAMSLLGLFVYGLMHHEPIGIFKKIKWFAKDKEEILNSGYYAAQGNASRIFSSKIYKENLVDWKIITIKKKSYISYVLSGGYSKPQLFPNSFLSFLFFIDRVCHYFPFVFATRLLVVIEKKG